MRSFVLVAFAMGAVPLGCGTDATHHLSDAPVAIDSASLDATPLDAAPVDAAPVPCTYIAATSTAQDVLSYTLTGGAFESFGCAPVDPQPTGCPGQGCRRR